MLIIYINLGYRICMTHFVDMHVFTKIYIYNKYEGKKQKPNHATGWTNYTYIATIPEKRSCVYSCRQMFCNAYRFLYG